MTFRIEYESGYMELVLDRFFPCRRADAVKVFRMVNRFCSRERKQYLYDYLADRAVDFLLDGNDAMHKRTLMNLRLLEVG